MVLMAIAVVTLFAGCNQPYPTAYPPTPSPPTQQPTPTPLPQQLPHLKITDVKVDPKPIAPLGQLAQLVSGTTYNFRFIITNFGPDEVYGNVVVRADYNCVNDCSAGIQGSSNEIAFVGKIEIEKPTIIEPISVKPDARGQYKFVFTVDPDNLYEPYDKSKIWEATVNVI